MADYWSWEGDGSDDLDSMTDGMKVLITAGQLRELTKYSSNRRFAIERQKGTFRKVAGEAKRAPLERDAG